MRRKNLGKHLLSDLSKTEIVQRLRHIGLSAVPRWLGPVGSTASRYQHSLGVGLLSSLIVDGTEYDRFLLSASAILHDVGHGPFPHISDQLMKEMLGFSHEGALRFAIKMSHNNDSLVILEKYGLDLMDISRVLEGKHRISPLLLGFPGLDNIDNVHRFMTTIPGRLLGEPSYLPSEMTASMSLDLKKQDFSKDAKSRWLRDYEKVYSYIWNYRLNMIAWTMLGRATRILKKDLTPNFLRLTTREAFNLIQLKQPRLTKALKKMEFSILFDKKYVQLEGDAQKLSEPANLTRIENELCIETGCENWSLGLTVDRPRIGEKPNHWRIYCVTYRDIEEPKILLENLLSGSLLYQ